MTEQETLDEILKEVKSLSNKVDGLEDYVKKITEGISSNKKTLTHKLSRAYRFVKHHPGTTVQELADTRDISYNAAYQQLEQLVKRGYIQRKKEEIGNGQKYYIEVDLDEQE